MNPSLFDTSQPNLVSALMDDRLREAAAARTASEALTPTLDTPHRFRRFLKKAAAPSQPRVRPAAPAPQGN